MSYLPAINDICDCFIRTISTHDYDFVGEEREECEMLVYYATKHEIPITFSWVYPGYPERDLKFVAKIVWQLDTLEDELMWQKLKTMILDMSNKEEICFGRSYKIHKFVKNANMMERMPFEIIGTGDCTKEKAKHTDGFMGFAIIPKTTAKKAKRTK
jgi:hypothetical protein